MAYNWDGFVVRAADDAALARVKEADSDAIALPGGFARLGWDSGADWTSAGSTRSWSTRFGEAWFFCAAGVSGVFAYEHGRAGEVVRSLGYYPDEGWVVVEGEAEAWEGAPFGPRQVAGCQRVMSDEPAPRWEKELAALETRTLVVGHQFPIADPEMVRLVAKELGTELIR